jgi:hypothetical protein
LFFTQTSFGAVKPGKTILPVSGLNSGLRSSCSASAKLRDQRRAMHLAGEADAFHRSELAAMRRLEMAHGLFGRGDPMRRILFGPAGMGARDIERAVRRGDDRLVGVNQQSLDTGRAEIEPEIHCAASSRPADRACPPGPMRPEPLRRTIVQRARRTRTRAGIAWSDHIFSYPAKIRRARYLSDKKFGHCPTKLISWAPRPCRLQAKVLTRSN